MNHSSRVQELEISGAKVAIFPIKELSATNIDILIKAGSWYEPENKWGAFHFLEHMCFQGTEQFPTTREMELFKEEHAINGDASTGGQNINFRFQYPETSIRQCFTLIHEMLFQPSIPETKLAREKAVIRQEYTDKWSSPYNRYSLACARQLYGREHIYIRDGIGQPEHIEPLASDDLRQLHQDYFRPSRMAIGIAG